MKTILYVEDDPNDVFFLQHAFERAGVANSIRVVNNGQEAIDYLKGAGRFADRDQFPLPGLVLLDLKLPYVMGMDVLKWIRQESGLSLVVVLLTASAEEADISSAYLLGANAFLVKPSEAHKLVDIAKAINAFWLMLNTLPQTPYSHSISPVNTLITPPGASSNSAASFGPSESDEPVQQPPAFQSQFYLR